MTKKPSTFRRLMVLPVILAFNYSQAQEEGLPPMPPQQAIEETHVTDPFAGYTPNPRGTDEILKQAGLVVRQTDDLRTKIIPALLKVLVDDDGFDAPSDKSPNFQRWLAEFEQEHGDPVLQVRDYETESLRPTWELMAAPLSKSCSTNARIFSQMLMDLGVPPANIRIVVSVNVDEAKKVCPQRKGSSWMVNNDFSGTLEARRISGTGHDMVEIKIDDAWYLLNTRDPSTGFDMIRFLAPDQLQTLISAGPVVLPIDATKTQAALLTRLHGGTGYTDGLLALAVFPPSQYPLHTFRQYINFIASGNWSDTRCRFTRAQIPRPKPAKIWMPNMEALLSRAGRAPI